MTLAEYYDKLAGFDWFFDFSDDHRVWKAGNQRKSTLLRMASEGGQEFKDLYAAFKSHHFSGPAWSTEKAPRPDRPE
jgi:hypothetical protein